MIKPETLSEKLQYTTMMITTPNGVGTGAIFRFIINDNPIDVLVTNKHVVNYKILERIKITIHACDSDGNNLTMETLESTVPWFHHNSKDLCYCFLGPLLNEFSKNTGRHIFYIPITEETILQTEKMSSLNAIEQVVMIGYPIGLIDPIHNLPLIRHGYTAYPPYYDYKEPGIGIIDIAAFPGSSGSPVFILNEGSYTDVKRHSLLPGSRLIFLGILFSGPVFKQETGIEEAEIPCSINDKTYVKMMTNLGYYIKASCIMEIKKSIEKIVERASSIIEK